MTNSVAIVTGASQGIGRATAVRLARDFGSVALVARNPCAKLEETAEKPSRPRMRCRSSSIWTCRSVRPQRRSSNASCRRLGASMPWVNIAGAGAAD